MGSYGEPFNIWGNLYHLVLPATVLSIDSLGGNTRYTRMSMLEVLHADYMTTAKAKGLSYYVVISRTRAHSEFGRRRSVFVRGLSSPRRGIMESSEWRLKQ